MKTPIDLSKPYVPAGPLRSRPAPGCSPIGLTCAVFLLIGFVGGLVTAFVVTP